MKKQIYRKLIIPAAFFAIAIIAVPSAHAALTATSTLTQTISNGALSTDIRDSSNVVVGSPAFGMSSVNVSTSQQSSTGTFGTSAQRISVDNPGGADGGFSLTLNATTPGTGNWSNGAGNTYLYNGTAATGQLTVDPSTGTITANTGGTTGISLGTSATFTGTTAITLLNAAAASADIWNGYVTGIGLTQTIPASTPAGTYTISMTQTVTAL